MKGGREETEFGRRRIGSGENMEEKKCMLKIYALYLYNKRYDTKTD